MINVSFSKKDLLALMEIAPTKEVRYYLNGVHLHVGFDFNTSRPAGLIETTNGHLLLHMALDAPDLTVTDNDTSYDVILDIDDLKRFVRAPKKSEVDTCSFILSRDNGVPSITYVDHSAGYVHYPIRNVEGKYPDTTRVLRVAHTLDPIEHKKPFSRIQANYLQTIAKITKYLSDTSLSNPSTAPLVRYTNAEQFLMYWPNRDGVIGMGMGVRFDLEKEFTHLQMGLPYWIERDLMDEPSDEYQTGT